MAGGGCGNRRKQKKFYAYNGFNFSIWRRYYAFELRPQSYSPLVSADQPATREILECKGKFFLVCAVAYLFVFINFRRLVFLYISRISSLTAVSFSFSPSLGAITSTTTKIFRRLLPFQPPGPRYGLRGGRTDLLLLLLLRGLQFIGTRTKFGRLVDKPKRIDP